MQNFQTFEHFPGTRYAQDSCFLTRCHLEIMENGIFVNDDASEKTGKIFLCQKGGSPLQKKTLNITKCKIVKILFDNQWPFKDEWHRVHF